jgi:myo-inositol-1(or 4)-monophosphatase
MTDQERTDWLAAAEEAARRGGAVLEDWRSRFSVREKARTDLVTDADLAAQQAVKESLTRRFPGHGFLGEEDASHHRPGPDAPPTWIVDPLDGTTNYVHDVPMYCVSIGLQAAGELVVGVVFDPRSGELFSAAKGAGATLNGRPITTSATDRLDQALLATGFPYDYDRSMLALDWWRYLARYAQSLRRTGSTALNLAYVAAGRFDGYWAFDNHVWDIAGGIVLVREAGGTATAVDGSPLDPYRADSVVTNGPLHAELLGHLRTGPHRGSSDPPGLVR